jgi:hypothetical protein
VLGYLVVPSGKGPFAAIIYMHWGQGNKGEFLSEAVEMAKGRAIGIMIDAPYWRPDLPPPSKGKETEQSSAHELVQFRCCHAPIEKSELACVAHLACGIQETGHCRAIE